MAKRSSKTTGPLHKLFSDISRIIEFMEIKDQKAADEKETSKSASAAEVYMNAMTEKDDYVTYHHLWNSWMFQEVVPNAKLTNITKWMQNPFTVPIVFRENLRIKGRELFLNGYEEMNEYYRMLNGMPPIDTPESEFIYLTEPLRNQLHASDEPVHKLSPIIQNSYMGTDEYKNIIKSNPDKKYLKYIGMYKIDPYVSRKAKDFDIIRYPFNRTDINPNLLTEFTRLYNDYREYVMATLYNPNIDNLYVNYRNFMGILIIISTLMQINNKAMEVLHSKTFLDDSIIHEVLSMYRIPNSLLLTDETRRRLVTRIYKLIQEKGTDDIYDDIINILQYDDVKINKLLLMKGQPTDGNSSEAMPYFLQVDINDKDPYDTISRGNAKMLDYADVTNPDPTWWDDEDTRRILQEYEYTVSDSKYITIETVLPQMRYLMESIYFSRLILDNKAYTDDFLIEIPEIFGTSAVSLYDLIVFIISATCMNEGVVGSIITDVVTPTATAGFNFDIDWDLFEKYVDCTKHVDKNRIMLFMENLTVRTAADITRLYNDVIDPMREWLQYKITYADDRHEYVEYENIYRALYTYDITRNHFFDDYRLPMENICVENGISDEEILMFKHFYPRTFSGKAITVDEYPASRYYPFINRINEIDWFIHVVIDTENGTEDRGYVYFHDILNSRDLRELTNPNGTRVFMDYEDSDTGWTINNRAVEKALELIDSIDENALNDAYMVIDTPVIGADGKFFERNTKLPFSIRSGLYKKILHDKLLRDMQGLSNPPATYKEYLYRKSPKLYELLTKGDRFNRDKDSWLNDVRRIVLAVETELNIHLKYFEQSVLGSEAFFKPLITLINRFKSTFVRIAKTSLRYMFDDKMDAGGNSNMLKLFDELNLTIHFVTLMNKGYDSQIGLFDTIHALHMGIILQDRANMLRSNNIRTTDVGSLKMSDEMKLFVNGKELDPSGSLAYWSSGDPGTGRWSEEDEILMKARINSVTVPVMPVDMNGWKEFVENSK